MKQQACKVNTLVALALTAALLFSLSGCTEGFFFGDIPVLLSGTPSPPPSPAPTENAWNGAAVNQVYGLAYTPLNSFQPTSERGRYNRQLIPLCYEGLYTLDADFTPVPSLCLSLDSEDGQVYSLSLRRDRLFWDGSPVTAADVAYSFALAVEGNYAGRFPGVTMAPDGDYGLVLEAPQPLYQLPALLDFPIVKKDSGTAAVAVGSGPYQLRLETESAYLLRNPHYPDAAGTAPERIELLAVTEENNLGYWFGNGSLRRVTLDLLDPLSQGIGKNYQRSDFVTAELVFLAFNHQNPWLSNAQLRRVCALAFDRESLCAELYGALIAPAALPLPPTAADAVFAASPSSLFHPAEAAALLEELGFSDTDNDGFLEGFQSGRREPLQLTLLVNAGNSLHVRLAENYAAALTSLGFAVELNASGPVAYQAALESGQYDLVVAQSLLAPNFDPGVFVGENGSLSFGYYDTETEALLDTLYRAPEALRGEALRAVFDRMDTQTPLLTLGFRLYSVCAAYENESQD